MLGYQTVEESRINTVAQRVHPKPIQILLRILTLSRICSTSTECTAFQFNLPDLFRNLIVLPVLLLLPDLEKDENSECRSAISSISNFSILPFISLNVWGGDLSHTYTIGLPNVLKNIKIFRFLLAVFVGIVEGETTSTNDPISQHIEGTCGNRVVEER